jgi:putative sterol carrier protein
MKGLCMDSIEDLIEKFRIAPRIGETNPVNAVILLNITGKESAQYHIKVDQGRSSVVKGSINDPDLSLSCSAEDLVRLAKGELDPGKAFMTGRLVISGDFTIALKLLGQINGR